MFCPTTRIRTASREAAERTLVDKLCYNNTGNMVEGGFLYAVTNILTIGRAMVQTKKLHFIWKQCSTVPAISFYVEEKPQKNKRHNNMLLLEPEIHQRITDR